jgi:hypothetical protein
MRTSFFSIGMAAGDHLDRVGIVRPGRLGVAAACQRVALDAVDLRPAPGRREAQPDAVLREPVARRDHALVHAVALEALVEAAQGLRRDRLGTVDDEAQCRKIEPFEILLVDAARRTARTRSSARRKTSRGICAWSTARWPGRTRKLIGDIT